MLRAADRRVRERAAEDKRAAEAREAKRAKVEREVEDELAAMKKKLKR